MRSKYSKERNGHDFFSFKGKSQAQRQIEAQVGRKKKDGKYWKDELKRKEKMQVRLYGRKGRQNGNNRYKIVDGINILPVNSLSM